MSEAFLWAGLFCLLPISELRGGLPYALSQGIGLVPAYLFCVFVNLLVAPVVLVFLNTLHRILLPLRPYRWLFDRLVARARRRVESRVQKYGPWGLAVFVGIPLPITGAYTGALGAWILGMKPRTAIPAISVGVLAAGIVVALAYYLVTEVGVEALRFLFKTVE